MREIVAQFDGYTLRTVDEQDYTALEAWILGDAWHNGILEPDFFLGQRLNPQGQMAPDARATCYALEDQRGTLFFIRLSRASRVHIQFDPEGNRKRVGMALVQGMAFLEVALGRAGAEEWIFETGEAQLANLARRHLGFRDSPGEMVRPIERVEPDEGHSGEMQGQQSGTGRAS